MDLYGADLLTASAAQTGGAAGGGNATLAVPLGQIWLVDALSADLTLVAGASFTTQAISIVLSWQRVGGISVHLKADAFDATGYATPIVVAENLSVGMFFERPLVALPGSILRADFLYGNGGTALDQFIQARYALLS